MSNENSWTVNAKATGAVLGHASTGTEQVAVSFKILDGALKDTEITWYGFLTEKSVDRTIESLRNAGWKGDDLADLSTVRGTCPIVVEEDDYNGKVRLKVKWVNGAGSGGPAVKDENRIEGMAAKQLAARMKARIQASDRAREQAAASGGGKAPF